MEIYFVSNHLMKYFLLLSALKSVSMGQGQEICARRLISDSMAGGGWVLLQNIHLSLPFCNEAMDALVETENVHETFRLWMTTEVHTQFPIALLQVSFHSTLFYIFNIIIHLEHPYCRR